MKCMKNLLKKKEKSMISKNFSEIEWQCKCGCGQMIVVPELVNMMQALRDIVKYPIIVHCVNRCAEHNKHVGGVDSSWHVKGGACDFHIPVMTNLNLHKLLDENKDIVNGGIGFYNWGCHVDIGLSRTWMGKNY